MLLFGYESGPIHRLLMNMSDRELGAPNTVLEIFDEEFKYSEAGQGCMSWRNFIAYPRPDALGIDEGIRDW